MLAQQNYLQSVLAITALFAEHFTAMLFLAYLRRTLSLKGPLERKKTFSSLSYPYLFQCGKESRNLSALCNMSSLGYFARVTQRMNWRNSVYFFGKDVHALANPEGEVAKIATISVVVPLSLQARLSTWKNFSSPRIATRSCSSASTILTSLFLMRNISDAQILSHEQFYRVYKFEHERETLSITTAATKYHFRAYGYGPSSTPWVLNEAKFMDLLRERNQLQALRDLQKTADVAWVEASLQVRCATRHDGHWIAKVEALKLRIM